ncbi:MAG: nuclear transport factor 2 family protein [Verrucomicrobiota bacterium]
MNPEDWMPPIREWHRVINERDLDAARNAVTERVEMGGPKGSRSGASLFAEWIQRAGIRLDPTSYYPVTSDVIVVAQDATWPDNPEANSADEPAKVATLFQLAGDRVARAIRFDSLQAAREAASKEDGEIAWCEGEQC